MEVDVPVTDTLAVLYAAACLSADSVCTLEGVSGSQQNGFCLGFILSSSEPKLDLVAGFPLLSLPSPSFSFFPYSCLSSLIAVNLQDCSFRGSSLVLLLT